ncbi:MAG: hypothetical protein F4227_08605 [Gammaproteobacteria bacterium]|nr:hypothetical protein [Gammaproteobacteria bacterium]MYF03009.1 hypothetical protein [Gammaproteobacteria bacterium]MYI78268.1 hypothetical protein [Gammaproteobacteria bacterium]
MLSVTLIRVITSLIVFGLALVQNSHAHSGGHRDNEGFGSSLETEPFLPVTDEHRAAWNRVLEHCLPLNTRESLSEHCLTALGEYFANEPVWSYNYMFVYSVQGWEALYHKTLNQRRNHNAADFLNPDVPFWRHIFDDQIEQRQELFIKVVNDSQCLDLASPLKSGMQDYWAEYCAAREMYQYAAYLSACYDARHRMPVLQRIVPEEDPEYGGLTTFEYSLKLLDEKVLNKELKSVAKRSMEKSYLHASWVAEQCSQQGFFVLIPENASSATAERLSWTWNTDDKDTDWLLDYTHDFIMKIAMKSGDDWAIRSGYLDSTVAAEFGADLMQRYPLLMHRLLGDTWSGWGYEGTDFTSEEHSRHRAKAYLLLVDQAGEEFARLEYDPVELAEEIQYVESGGLLRSPPSLAEVEARRKARSRQFRREQLKREA